MVVVIDQNRTQYFDREFVIKCSTGKERFFSKYDNIQSPELLVGGFTSREFKEKQNGQHRARYGVKVILISNKEDIAQL